MYHTFTFLPGPTGRIAIFDQDGSMVWASEDFRTTREALNSLQARFAGKPVRLNVVNGPNGEPIMATVEDQNTTLEIQIPPETEAVLSRLAARIKGTREDVFSWALALLNVVVEATDKGQKVVVLGKDGKQVTEITLFPEGH